MHVAYSLMTLGLVAAAAAAPKSVPLSSLRPRSAMQGWGALGYDKSVRGNTLQIGERKFKSGLGTHATSEVVYRLAKRYERFEAWVGVDNEMRSYKEPSVVFQVFCDGEKLFDSDVMKIDTPAKRVEVPVTGVKLLKLVVTDAGDGINCDHADWADAVLIGQGPPPPPKLDGPTKYTVGAPGIAVELSANGTVSAVRLGGSRRTATGYSQLEDFEQLGPVKARKLSGGGIRFVKHLKDAAEGNACTVTETFRPTPNSVRWEMRIEGEGKPWSTAVETHFNWPAAKTDRFWTAWGHGMQWTDPLVPQPFKDETYNYGGYFSVEGGTALPMATVLDPKHDLGFSIVQALDDTLLEMDVHTRADGSISFTRTNNRLGTYRVTFSVDLVPHQADFRSALAWVVGRYPKYFDPPNPRTYDVGGGGAYSGYEGSLDAAKMHKMSFRMNWKASIDFPYMGVFLPPVGYEEQWNRFAGGGAGGYGPGDEGRFGKTSMKQMEDYSKRMRADGFHVLNYFNCTELGGNVEWPAPPRKAKSDADLWKDPNDLVYGKLKSAILMSDDKPLWTWGGAIIFDCGDPAYRDFLLEQAKRHIDNLPDSSGIVIDRLDWLSRYNMRADDGVSWIDGPARSLKQSWIKLLDRLGPLMHKADKVIYVNCMIERPDLMRQIDGIYDEFGMWGHKINMCSFVALRKPVVCWTPDENTLKPDPDAYFQRHLYMGAFPTCPLPANDHTINPSEWAEPFYLDYGPLLNTLVGRKWVLMPHVVECEGAKANVFEVPGGWAVPVTFGGKAKTATVTLRGLPFTKGTRVEVLHPGGEGWQPVAIARTAHSAKLQVPLVRGCAMVRIAKKS